MKNVLILGASGNIAEHVIDKLAKKEDTNLTLFLRNKRRLRNDDVANSRIVEGDVLNYHQLREAVTGQDIVYANLADEPEKGSVISQKSLATFITKIIETPEKYTRESLGINKPNS
jgi:saccharopine dehydrogenase-like NADP-dependent oxidoreductase